MHSHLRGKPKQKKIVKAKDKKNMKKWNFGIIGAGTIADFHARAINSLPNAVLTGISGSNQNKASELAERYHCKAYANYQQMLDDKDIHIVTIATPSGAHMEPAIEAAKKGKHVICEKPLEISLDRIDRMIEAHAKAGTQLGGIFNYRFNEPVRLIKAVIDENRFGTISYANVEVPWWRTDEYYKSSWRGTWKLDGGGALMNQSIHMVDMLQYLVGPVESLQGYIATAGHAIEVEDVAAAVLKFRNNALGNIYGSTASWPGQFRRLQITGTKGTVVMVENSITMWQFADQSEADEEIRKRFSNIEGGGGVSDPKAIPFELHAKNIEAFIKSLEEGNDFEIHAQEARKAVEIITAIYASAKSGKPYMFKV